MVVRGVTLFWVRRGAAFATARSYTSPDPTRTTGAFGADDGTRSRDLHLGKVAFYQLNYVRRGE